MVFFFFLIILYLKAIRKINLDAVYSYGPFIFLVQALQALLIFRDPNSYPLESDMNYLATDPLIDGGGECCPDQPLSEIGINFIFF